MIKRMSMSVAGLAVACACGLAVGQEREQPQVEWVYVIQEFVKPSMMQEYEATTREMIEMLKSKGISEEKVQFSTISGPEMGYSFGITMDSFGAMDTMMQNWQSVVAELGEPWKKLEEKGSKAVDKRTAFHVVRRPDLSYMPDEPRLAKDEVKYVNYGFYYVTPGMELEIEKLARQFAKLYEEKGLNDAWTIYQSVTGADLPLYIVAFPGTSVAEFHARDVEIQEALGEQGEYLGQQVISCTRRLEKKEGWVRPDLSYPQ